MTSAVCKNKWVKNVKRLWDGAGASVLMMMSLIYLPVVWIPFRHLWAETAAKVVQGVCLCLQRTSRCFLLLFSLLPGTDKRSYFVCSALFWELTDADEQGLKGLRLDAKTKQVGYRCLYHAILFVRHEKLFQGIKDVVVVFSCRKW